MFLVGIDLIAVCLEMYLDLSRGYFTPDGTGDCFAKIDAYSHTSLDKLRHDYSHTSMYASISVIKGHFYSNMMPSKRFD